MKLLFESKGNILDDEKLIETLDASKVNYIRPLTLAYLTPIWMTAHVPFTIHGAL